MSKRLVRPRRVDGNHSDIAQAYEALGCRVYSTAALGFGFPDLVVAWGGICSLVEVKDGTLPPSRRALTDREKEFARDFPVRLVESKIDVASHVAAMKRMDLCLKLHLVEVADVYNQDHTPK
jgi:hypothetical protein